MSYKMEKFEIADKVEILPGKHFGTEDTIGCIGIIVDKREDGKIEVKIDKLDYIILIYEPSVLRKVNSSNKICSNKDGMFYNPYSDRWSFL